MLCARGDRVRCACCCWCPQVTLIREYAQGPNALLYCLPTGGLDPRRHADLADCAARELSEEVRLGRQARKPVSHGPRAQQRLHSR